MEEKQLGMRWLKIYTIIFAIRVVIITLAGIVSIPNFLKTGLSSDPIEAARTVVYSIEYAFAIFTCIHFVMRTELGYYLNNAYLVIEPIAIGIVSVIKLSITEKDIPLIYIVLFTVLFQGIVLLAWALPNYIYFKHRKFLFSGKLVDKIHARNVDKRTREKSHAVPQVKNSLTNDEIATQTTIPSDELRILKELHEEGVLTDEEFENKKRDLLGI